LELHVSKQWLKLDNPFIQMVQKDYHTLLRTMGHDEKIKELVENYQPHFSEGGSSRYETYPPILRCVLI
jgi:hypothetical protein